MSSVPQLSGVRGGSSLPKLRVMGGVVLALVGAAGLGAMVGRTPQLALLFAALAFVVLATPLVDQLSVACFWFLPYLILNLPLGGLTLKVPEVTAYLFAAAAIIRSLLRRESIALPPPTPQVLLYLGVCAVSAMLSPTVPGVFAGYFSGLQGADLRSFSILFWLALSWVVVVAMYNVIGTNPDLYRRCVRAHILTGAISSLIGIVGYTLALRGYAMAFASIGNSHSFVFTGGSAYRLTGVSYEPLMYAFYLVTVIPVTLSVMLFRPDWMPRWLARTALVLQNIAMLLTFAAGGWAALAVEFALLAWLFRPKHVAWKKVGSAVLAVGVVAAAAFAFFTGSPMLNRVMGMTVSKITSGGYQERDDEFMTGMRMFQDHFWLGVGPGMVPFYIPTYHPSALTMSAAPTLYVVNLYVTALAETGVLGLLAIVLCGLAGLAALVRLIRFHGATQVPVLTAVTVALIGCAIQYWEAINLFLIYFTAMVGLAVAGTRLAQVGPELPA